jgi:hypothetical protein
LRIFQVGQKLPNVSLDTSHLNIDQAVQANQVAELKPNKDIPYHSNMRVLRKIMPNNSLNFGSKVVEPKTSSEDNNINQSDTCMKY